ncbi:MAG: amidohydrolase family protein [Phycisphaerales bacterium]|nr:amidohydrolase family protein [Phycisphaerales bacterium]
MLVRGRLLTDPDRAPTPGWLRVEAGRIAEMGEGEPPGRARPDVGGPDRIICPGFIDAHLHIPQFDAVGCDGMGLLEWLERVIYPAERWFGAGAARTVTRLALRRMLAQGTLGFAGYLTSHGEATREAVSALEQSGVRCIVGRVAMDREAPDDLTREDRERARMAPRPSALAPAARGGRVEISANPRFAISCSAELLAEVGWLRAEREGLCVQTHLAESAAECGRVRALFPEALDYTDVYERAGLLGPRTILAHGCHLSEREWALIAERGCVVAHCPTANVFLRSGLFNLDAARRHGVRVALGSDVAAGADVAMPRVARAMIETAKIRAMLSGRPGHVPTPGEAWRLITSGNGAALGWADAGTLCVGAPADLLVLRAPETWLDGHLIGRLVYNWSGSLIETRVVGGAVVDPASI